MTTTTLALTLVVGCSVAFSVSDLFRKLLATWVSPLPLLLALSLGMAPAFAIWCVIDGKVTPAAGYWLPGIGSVILNVGSNLALLEAVRRSPLSLTIPMLSLTPVFTTLLAIPLLGEIPSGRQWVGVGLVVVGAFWINLELGSSSVHRALSSFASEPGSRLAILVAVLWSLAMPLDKLALHHSSPAMHGLVLSLGVGLGVITLAWTRGALGRFHELWIRPWMVGAGVVVSIAAIAFQLIAIALVWVGLVETLKRGIGSLLSQLWGRLIFDEPLESQRLAAVLVMGAGVALILL